MGHNSSKPACFRYGKSGTHEEPPKDLKFDPSKSYAVCYGINKQRYPNEIMPLSQNTVIGAQRVRKALIDVKAVYAENATLYVASEDEENCTADGIRRTFEEAAKKVEPNGLFVFHFSGHGLYDGRKKWGLVPVDLSSARRETLITSEKISSWLNKTECKAKSILVILDCCYAGGIGENLTSTMSKLKLDVNLYILSACTANEISILFNCIKQSVFTYFLSKFIVKFTRDEEASESCTLPLSDIFSESQICCENLMRLFKESVNLQLNFKERIKRRPVTDGNMERFEYVMKLYNEKLPEVHLCDETKDFLKLSINPLFEIEDRKLLHSEILELSLCCIMYSIALTELESDVEKVENPNLSIIAFMEAASIIDAVHPDVEIEKDKFASSWRFYRQALHDKGKKPVGLDNLGEDIIRELLMKDTPRVEADSDEAESLTPRACHLERFVSNEISLLCLFVCVFSFRGKTVTMKGKS